MAGVPWDNAHTHTHTLAYLFLGRNIPGSDHRAVILPVGQDPALAPTLHCGPCIDTDLPRHQRLMAVQVQRCTLLSIKTGGCPENCGYCRWARSTGEQLGQLIGLCLLIVLGAPTHLLHLDRALEPFLFLENIEEGWHLPMQPAWVSHALCCCSQSSHWSKDTGLKAEKLMDLEEVYQASGGPMIYCD